MARLPAMRAGHQMLTWDQAKATAPVPSSPGNPSPGAGPAGTAAFPSVATLVRYTGLSERTVCTCLDRLHVHGVISPRDPGHRRGAIKRAGRRPQGWDLNLGMIRHDLAEADIAVLERQFPGLAARIATASPPGTDEGRGRGAATAPRARQRRARG